MLEGINLDIPANSTLALVGPTGVGKTTLASLVPRFYDVHGGRITLDGHDLRDISLASLRQQISRQLAGVQSVLDGMLVDQPRRRILRQSSPAPSGKEAAR